MDQSRGACGHCGISAFTLSEMGSMGEFGQKSELLMSFQQDHSAAMLRAALLMVVDGSKGGSRV